MSTKKTAKKSTKKATKKSAKSVKKKTVRKKAAASTKKSTGRKGAQNKRSLVNAPGEHCFWVSDGEVLANLVDLSQALERMADDVFRHHVTKEKNDFAEWVAGVLGDKELASSIRRSRKPETARVVVVRRLRVYDV